jgi:hypothetical protein
MAGHLMSSDPNMNLHAAAIARWDDEGDASRVAEQEQIPKDQGQQRPRRMEGKQEES